jgi:hypothetical protein
MLHNWLRRGFRPARTPTKQSAPRRSYRPQLETLESRWTPSTFAPIGTFPSFGQSSGPSVIITFGPNGAVSTTNTGVGPFDGTEDTMVGVRNNSGHTIFALPLTGSPDIFDFDGDGIQTFGSPATGTTGYEGPGTTFSNISGGTGTVNFTGGLPTGFQAYFSLEGSPDSLNITPLILNETVFFPYRPNFRRPSMSVLGWVQITNNGGAFTQNLTVSFNLPGVTITPMNATKNVVAKGSSSITVSGGMNPGDSFEILCNFTYPPSMSLDGIRNALNSALTFTLS